jgi:hypothetical protein
MRYLLLILLLTGCVTQEQRAERHINRFSPYCEKLGYERNTDPWRQCVMEQAKPRGGVPQNPYKTQRCTPDGSGGVVCTGG